jgi:uncharacterized protein
MLRVDLGQLDREGSVDVEASVSADDPLWDDTGLEWDGDVDVGLKASYAGTGEVVARGRAKGSLRQECRRCLQPVFTPVDAELTLVFVEDPDEEDIGDVFPLEPQGLELDLSDAVREEIVLAVNPYVVCKPDCRGLCPRCGTNWNDESCDCSEDDADPRWAALRKLKKSE